MKKWEYLEGAFPCDRHVAAANQAGQEGWELFLVRGPVGVMESALATEQVPGYLMLFKREIEPTVVLDEKTIGVSGPIANILGTKRHGSQKPENRGQLPPKLHNP